MWYSDLVVNEVNFRSMALQFGSLQLPLFSSKLSLKSGTGDYIAYADIKGSCIVINDYVLNGRHSIYKNEPMSTRLEVCNGIIIHEIGHFMFSSENVDDYKLDGKVFTPNIGIVCNVIEDIYLEDALSKVHNFAAYFLHKACSVVIDNDVVESCFNFTTGNKPTTLEEAEAYVQYIISYKRRDYPFLSRSDWETKIYEMILSVVDIHDCKKRIEVAHRVYREIFGELEKQDVKENSQETSGASSILLLSKDSEESGDKESFSFYIPLVDFDDEKVKLELKNDSHWETYTVLDILVRKTSFTEVQKVNGLSNNFPLKNVDFSPLITLENARSSIRSVRGVPQNSGRNMTHLHRAMDDGKIFSANHLDGMRAGKGSPEIIFLVDLSGSMASAASGDKNSCSKIVFALSCIYELNKVLSQTRIKFSIIGHTTKTRGHINGVLITSFKEFRESVTNDSMFNRIATVFNNFRMNGNADSNALLYANKMFSKGLHDKIILVISDGAPSESYEDEISSYGIRIDNSNMYNQLIEVVKYLRSSGIKVFSASIDSVAFVPCNKIYGEANNVMFNNALNLMSIISRSLS